MAENKYSSYEQTSWSPGKPITGDLMNKLEKGVSDNRDYINEINNEVSSHESSITNIKSGIGSNTISNYNGRTLWEAIASLYGRVDSTTSGSQAGIKAWNEIKEAVGTTTLGDLKESLAEYLSKFTTADNELKEILGTVINQNGTKSDVFNTTNTVAKAIDAINIAIGSDNGVPVFGVKDSEDNLVTVLSTIRALTHNVDTVLTALNNAAPSTEYTSLANRLSLMSTDINNNTTELKTARTSSVYTAPKDGIEQPRTFDNLDQRLENIESILSENTGAIGNVNTNINDNYVRKADVRNDFISSDTNLPLSAIRGKELRDMIGGTYNPYATENPTTVTSTINSAASTAEANAKSYADANKVAKTNIYNNLDYEPAQDATDDKVLDARQGKALKNLIDDLDTAYKAADTALDTRVSDTESAIETLNGSGEGSVINTVNNQIAAVVAEAPESLDTLQEIASWISSHSDSASAMNDQINTNANAIAALQDTITDETTGLAATKAIADAAAVKTEVDSSLNELDARLDAIDGGETLTGTKTLATRVSEAESAITTLQNEPKSATEIVAELPQTGDETKDYLVGPNEDGKYFYYKWINNTWNLISGGGSGEGTSSAQFAASLPITDPDINTDYYVGNNTDGYLHYRYVEQSGSETLAPVLIGVNPEKVKTYNMIKTTGGTESEPINYLDLYEFNYGENNILRDDDLPPVSQRIAHIVLPQGGGGSASTSNTVLTRIAPTAITTIFNGQGIFLRFFYSCYDNSGEPYEGTYTLKNSNNITLLSDTVNSGAAGTVITGWPSDHTDGIKYDDGYVSINVEPFCRLGMNTFNLEMVTGTNETLYRQYTVDIKELRLESNAPETLISNLDATAELLYTPFGALEKYLHVFIDDVEADTVRLGASNTGNELSYNIPAQTQGHHKIKFYLSTELNGKPINTDPPITRDYIWCDTTAENVTILASSYRDETKNITQYDEVEIPYTLYSTDSSVLVEYFYDYNPEGENTPFSSAILSNTNNGLLRYSVNEDGNHNLAIKANNEVIMIYLSVEELPIDIAPVGGAIIDFNPALLTNTSVGREPEWVVNKGQANEKTYKLSVSDNFNWSTNPEDSGGGYRDDVDGKCFIIRAGDYATLNYKMFAQNNVVTNGITKTTSKVFDQGAEIKIIFKVSAVRNADAVWLTNMGRYVATSDKEVGIQLSAHNGWLKTDKATTTTTKITEEEIIEQGYALWEADHVYSPGDIVVVKKKTIYECIKETTNSVFDDDEEKKWRKLGQLETEVGATNSYLYFPYSEDDKIELDININKTGNSEDFIMSYEDGVPSKAYPYDYAAGGDILYQVIGQESDIRIGSPDCDVYIYRIKVYDNGLQTNQILKNFIADGKDITERVNRYNRNSIYYNSSTGEFTPYASASAILDPIQLAKQLPDVKILMLETPRFTTGKKDFVRGTLRCIQAQGGKVYPATDADNWFFFNGYHAGQGTTSDNYGQSARNVDFLFECDGTHYPTKKKNLTDFEKNWQSAVIHGNDGSVYRDLRDPTNAADNQVIRGQWEPASGATLDVCDDDWMGTKCKVSLTHNPDTGADTSIPNNYFNLKVNVASSENVNNALFQKRYNDFLPYNSPAKQRDARIKNGMEFVPAILFIRETGEGTHSEFNDNNWHFYALGNIGDSKKSDYTRAYDPDDMNEFTIEISDNNTSNSQFQSGVYKNASTNNIEIVETTGTETDPMDYVYPITYEQWNAKNEQGEYINYRHKTLSTEGFDGDHSFEFRYACRGDYRDGDLINDTNGDSTVPNPDPEEAVEKPYLTKDDVQFNLNRQVWEAFYEWVITSSEAQFRNEAAQWIIPEAMEFFYAFTHYYTMMDNRAKNTFWHFAKTGTYRKVSRPVAALLHVYHEKQGDNYVPTADTVLAPTYYEDRYSLTTDTKFSSDKVYYTLNNNVYTQATIIANTDIPVDTYYEHSYVLTNDVSFIEDKTYYLFNNSTYMPASVVTGEIIKYYYTQYAFDLWIYDTDTACGIDNNGELVFPYGKEDMDYRTDDPQSGWAFNGSGSIFWRRLSKTFADGITTVMRQSTVECFSDAQHLINQFDKFQECYPEEIWRLDIQRKYIRTFTGKSYDNSITKGKQNIRFLKAMMQGRKKYQRRQWVRDQSIYFGSKYFLNNVGTDAHTIEFNTYTPSTADGVTSLAVPVDREHVVVVPYQDMYINVAVGNSTTNIAERIITDQYAKRAKAGDRVIIDCRSGGSAQETRVYIYGAEHIAAIENLAPAYTYSGSFGQGVRLKSLDLGSDNPEYNNPRFTSLSINARMPILESFSVKNCNMLGGTINLSQSNNLRTFEAQGSSITGVSLPNYTHIQQLHLPSTVENITLSSARYLSDFFIHNNQEENDFSSLISLNIDDSDYSDNVNWLTIAKGALDGSLDTLYLQRLSHSSIGDISELEPFAARKKQVEIYYDSSNNLIQKIVLTGILNVTGYWSEIERDNYMTVWPQLTFDTSAGTKQTKHKVTYKFDAYEDNEGNIVNGEIIKELYINDGAPAPDIYSDGTLSEMPHRDPTVRFLYEFGSIDPLNNNEYIPYSGWQLSGSTTPLYEAGIPTIRQDTVIETHFETVSRAYYVKWFMNEDPTSLVKTSVAPVAYGDGYELEAPTVAEIHEAGKTTCTININNGQATYSIFNGWEKLPTNITPSAKDETYNIYATYDTGTVVIDDLFNANNLDNLTPVQLLVLSALDSSGKSTYGINNKIAAGKRVTYTMGQDSIAEGITLVSGNPLRLDSVTDTSFAFDGKDGRPLIQPLKSGNDAFTLAIDYCFNPNATYSSNASFAVLASVYYGSTTEGIRNGLSLFYGLNSSIYGLRVGWGDMYSQANQSRIVGNTTNLGQRNIIVLRHPKGSNQLYIYSGLNGNINTPENIVVETPEWSNYNSNAYLNFGRLTSEVTDSTDDIPNTVVNGKGTIFWAKYWPEDLGVGECKRLAAWPHETITYAISQLKNSSTSTTRVSSTAAVSPSIYLSALTASSHIKIAQAKVQGVTNFSARDYSIARTLCNKRIFAGLPTNIQAIMCQPNISYTQVIYTSDQNSGQASYTLNDTSALIGKDYVFQYSAGNLISKVSAYIQREDGNFPWLNNNVVAYTYSSSGGWTQNSSDTNSYYMNIRSPFKALTWSGSSKMRVFREYSTQIPSNVQIASSIASTGEIRSGDIYIDTYNQAYIYVLNSEIQALGIQIMPTTGDYAKFNTSNLSNSSLRGGWVRAEDYWTRSAIAGSNAENFAYANEYGEVEVLTTSSAKTTGLNVMYTFAI